MTSCRYCENHKESTYACKKCFSELVYKTDAIKSYGLTSEDLEDVECIIFDNPWKKSLLCYKYHKNDLYKKVSNLISELKDSDKRKDILLKRKKIIDQIELEKKELEDMRKHIVKTVRLLLKKCDNDDKKYIKYYDEKIEELSVKYADKMLNINDISFRIYLEICKFMVDEKKINDLKLIVEKYEINLFKKILMKCKFYKDYRNIVEKYKIIYSYCSDKLSLADTNDFKNSIILSFDFEKKKLGEDLENFFDKVFQRLFKTCDRKFL